MKGLHLVIKQNHQQSPPTSGRQTSSFFLRRNSRNKNTNNDQKKKNSRRNTAPPQELYTKENFPNSASRPNYDRSKSENNVIVGDGWESTAEFLSHVMMSSSAPVLSFSNPVGDNEEEKDNHSGSTASIAADEKTNSSKIRVLKEGAVKEAQAIFGKISIAFQSAGHALEQKYDEKVDNIATKLSQKFNSFKKNDNDKQQQQPPVSMTKIRNGGILLHGCIDAYDHNMTVRETVENLRPLKGRIGLKVAGFEYRVVSINYVNPPPIPSDAVEDDDDDDPICLEPVHEEKYHATSFEQDNSNTMSTTKHDENDDVPEIINEELQLSSSSSSSNVMAKQQDNKIESDGISQDDDNVDEHDESTMMTRLFHIETNTMITSENRRRFIVDGDMYDAMARLCQEYAQEIMMKEGNMEWVTVSEAGNNAEPIRALVNEPLKEDDSLLDQKPTLLIATGRGKVRAGIFSRQHILISGLECSTALPIIRQAKKRQMNVVMLDPNAHGQMNGMITFKKSMEKVFSRWESSSSLSSSSDHCPTDRPPLAKRDLFVLSHSQSGAQLANYLLEKSEHYVPHIRAVAFTDATHNIQWAKEKKDLHELLESERCVYFRCSKQQQQSKSKITSSDNALEPLDSVGQEVETDIHWQQRFGQINTRCAGTSEHSLTNWFVRFHIWDHFDSFMGTRRGSLSSSQCQHDVDKAVCEGDII